MKNISILALSVIALATLSSKAHADVDFDINIGIGGPGHYYDERDDYSHNDFRGAYLGPQVLGETRLSFRNDRDVVMVNSCARGMAIDAVRLSVHKNEARIDYVVLTLGNGNRMELNVRERFGRGTTSRWIPLNGERCIKSFVVFGSTDNFGGREAKVKLTGNAYRTN